MLRFLVVAAVLGLSIAFHAVADGAAQDAAQDAANIERLFSAKGVSVLRSPKSVVAYRIEGSKPIAGAKDDAKTIAGYPRIAGPIEVDAEQAKALTGVLLDSNTYLWDIAKRCSPRPGVLVRFTGEDGYLDVLFCFECDILEVFDGGKRVGLEDFDNARPRLVALMKKLFPDDKVVQGLAEKAD